MGRFKGLEDEIPDVVRFTGAVLAAGVAGAGAVSAGVAFAAAIQAGGHRGGRRAGTGGCGGYVAGADAESDLIGFNKTKRL